jgi:hypothetical protein
LYFIPGLAGCIWKALLCVVELLKPNKKKVFIQNVVQLTKGVRNHSAELAKSIMKHLESSGYQSFGLSLGCDRNPRWEDFSFSLISYLWRYSSKLKYPVILYCFGGSREIFDELAGRLYLESFALCCRAVKT